MTNDQDLEFSFVKEINEAKTYHLLFPKRDIGLAILLLLLLLLLCMKVSDGTFIEQKFTKKVLFAKHNTRFMQTLLTRQLSVPI